MCGIAGVIGRQDNLTEDAVGAMVHALAHRGPDDRGLHSVTYGESVVRLGNTRLSILDLSAAGHLPMRDSGTANWIAYNGEVFNFREIRRDLESRGARFESETDTEVVLKAYAEFGPACVALFRGMFGFAIWDARRQELFLCRDRLGLKPLYYSELPEGLLFASEVRAVLASGLVKRKLDPVALDTFLANGYVVSPHTMVSGVSSLLPGTWMRVGLDGQILETYRYWKVPGPGRQGDPRELEVQAREHLAEAVRLRMVSDVPLGAFLSGGMDSSTVVALMTRNGGDVRTFAVTFEEAAYDESSYSRAVAEQFGTHHTEVKLERRNFYEMVPAALAAMDQPTYDGVNTYCVSRAARESGLKVALSGLGADELFGGYGFFNSARTLARTEAAVRLLPHALTRAVVNWLDQRGLAALSGPWKAANLLATNNNGAANGSFRMAAYQTTQLLFPPWSRRTLLSTDFPRDGMEPALALPPRFVKFLEEELEDETDPTSVFSKLALRLFLGERCLRDTDSMSMGVSLEVRAPFTDHILLESLMRFAGTMRCEGAPDKPVLRRIVEPFLGEKYPRRSKQGFIFPFQEWLPAWQGFSDFSVGKASAQSLAEIGFNPAGVERLFERFRRDPAGTRWSRVWAIFIAVEWCRRHQVHL
jgi:asparagine synthase (glutamine-hydrolysing)